MQITRTGEYGLRGLLFLAKQPPEKVALVSEVSRAQRIPGTFLAKIFQRLSKAGVLKSIRGSGGGFYLARPAGKITMKEVIEALEGPIAINRCLMRKGTCNEEEECPLHEVWERAQKGLLDVLTKTTMEDLAKRTSPEPDGGR
jgi:Rrf2 family protein